jgi:hypothetical protein
LIAGVWAIYDPDRAMPADVDGLTLLDVGGQELLSGFAGAVAVRVTIQQAVRVIMDWRECDAQAAYE